MIGLIDFLIV
uniref:Uncharacterized protein n=1 Tax=Rhizophora mucronata TaxID=61149 RepID=A0A2P2PTE5_RHIMU